MKIRLLKYILCNSKIYFMSMCIFTCEMFCFHRSSLSSFHHNTHMFERFLILYKFLLFNFSLTLKFNFLIINIALSLCYLVVTSWLTRRFVTSRCQVPSFKMALCRVQVETTHLSQYRIQLTVEISGARARMESDTLSSWVLDAKREASFKNSRAVKKQKCPGCPDDGFFYVSLVTGERILFFTETSLAPVQNISL